MLRFRGIMKIIIRVKSQLGGVRSNIPKSLSFTKEEVLTLAFDTKKKSQETNSLTKPAKDS